MSYNYNSWKHCGLTKKRYNQMVASFGSETFIKDAIENWGVDNVNKGYAIFNFDGLNMYQIEEIGDTDAFGGSDDLATEQAMRDGIKIIPIEELPKNFSRRYLGWIDTPENRKAIFEYCEKKDNYYCI